MAREAGIDWTDFEINAGFNVLKAFEALVRADERALAAPVQERNFCERCGKRLGDFIHTCTPPTAQQDIQRLSALVRAQQITIDKLEAQRQWVGLTEEERVDLWKATETDNRMVLIDAIEAKLKEKNT
jgi:hypothetical protein